MFEKKLKFYLGDGTDHVIKMTEKQALAANHTTFTPEREDDTSMYGVLNLPDGCTMNDYNKARDILNSYLRKSGPVSHGNPEVPILKPVKPRKKKKYVKFRL